MQNKNFKIINLCADIDDIVSKYDLLSEFKSFNLFSVDYFKNHKGCYAFYLNNINCVNDFVENAKKHTLLSFRRYENTTHERLFYIGKTNCSFWQRVCSGHLKAKSTAPNRTLANFLFGIDKSLYKDYQESLKLWLQKNITVKFLEIDKDSDINLIESCLIHLYQPPLNKDGCDEHTEE